MGVERTGYLALDIDPFPGFTIICVIYSKLLSISYESVVALPFLGPLFITILVLITQKISASEPRIINLLIVGSWMLFFGTRPTFFCHSIGLALFFVVIYISFLRLESNKLEGNIIILSSVLLLILIVAIDMISYKLIFFTIFFLIIIQSVRYLEKFYARKNFSKNMDIKLTTIILIAFVISLSFNWFLYNSAIPVIRTSSEHPLEGLSNLFLQLNSLSAPKNETSFESYQYVGHISRLPLYLLWYALVGISIIACLYSIILKFSESRTLSFNEACIASIIITGVIIFFLYTTMGHNDLSFILTAGVLGYSKLINSKTMLFKKIFTLFSLILLLDVVIMNLFAVADNSYGGQTDQYEFQYLKHPAIWYNTYHKQHMYRTYADQLTKGYFLKEAFFVGKPYISVPLSKDIVLSILGLKSSTFIMPNKNNTQITNNYIFNYKLDSISLERWFKIKSWSNYRDIIHDNHYMDIIYSSGYIDICTSKE